MLKLAQKAKDCFSKVFKSFTCDNESEFTELASLEENTSTKAYFAHTYSSGERDTNERLNGLIRCFIPKVKCISDFSVKGIARVQIWCNTSLRKILN